MMRLSKSYTCCGSKLMNCFAASVESLLKVVNNSHASSLSLCILRSFIVGFPVKYYLLTTGKIRLYCSEAYPETRIYVKVIC